MLALDTKTSATLDTHLVDLPNHFEFFLPWAGIEKTQLENLNYADVKAAEKMARLYDEIIKHNQITTATDIHNLNVFFSRLLFCFFAEDTNVFEPGQFTNAIASTDQCQWRGRSHASRRSIHRLNTEQSARETCPPVFEISDTSMATYSINHQASPIFSAKASKSRPRMRNP